MIVEGIVATLNPDGSVNIAPMGPMVETSERGAVGGLLWRRLTLRPFRTSTTFANLERTGRAVFHVTDDVELLAKAAIGALDPLPPLEPTPDFPVPRLADACHWHAVEIESADLAAERATFVARVVAWGRLRDFPGFNRAKHAVVEAAILATRVGIVPRETIDTQFAMLKQWVDKTGGEAERRAFSLLADYVRGR